MKKGDYIKSKASQEESGSVEFCTIDLPLERLKQLLDWEDQRLRPPVNYSIINCEYEGEVRDDDCYFKCRIKIEVYSDRWIFIPLLQSDGIVKTSKCKNGGSFGFSKSQYCFMVKGEGIYEIELEFFLPFISKERKNGVKLVSYSSGRLHLKIPKPNLRCTLLPALGVNIKEEKEKTEILAYIGAGQVNIGWTPKFEEEIKKDLKPIIHGEVHTSVIIGEALIRCKSTINYSIYQAGVISFVINIFDAKVMNVNGKGIRTYDIDSVEEENIVKSTIKVFLDYEATKNLFLDIQYEKKMDKPSMTADVPVISLSGVERENGYIGISSKTNVEIKKEDVNNLTVIDSAELPDYMRDDLPPVFSFKYLKSPYKLSLDIKRHEELPVLICIADKGVFSTTVTNEGKIITHIKLMVRNNSKQFINFTLPDKAQCLSSFVDKDAVKPAKGDKNEVMIPLPKLNQDELQKNIFVEIVWIQHKDKIKKRGKASLNMGLIDIPVSKLGWQVFLPSDFKYFDFRGNVKDTGYLTVTITEDTHVSKPAVQPVTSNIMQAQIMDQFSEEPEMEESEPDIQMTLMKSKSFFGGALPVKIDIPKVGNTYYFEKMFVQDEEIKLSYKYKKKFKLIRSKKEVKLVD